MQHTDPTALLVEPDAAERARLALALEALGFDVLACPGPSAPDYGCVGERTGACPLASGADIVVMDARLARGNAGEGVGARTLLELYRQAGKRCVVLADDADALQLYDQDRVTVLRRTPERYELIQAIRGDSSPAARKDGSEGTIPEDANGEER